MESGSAAFKSVSSSSLGEFRSASVSYTGFTSEVRSGGGGCEGRLPPPFFFLAALDLLLGLGLELALEAGAGDGVVRFSIFAGRRDESIVIARSNLGEVVPSFIVSRGLQVSSTGKVRIREVVSWEAKRLLLPWLL